MHLELTRVLSAQAFLLAFRRFSSRRGLPATITSDNARSFKSSCKDFRKITRSELRYMAVCCKRTNHLELHYRELGPMVGRVLRKTRAKHQTTTQESLHWREVNIEFRWAEYSFGRDWRSDQLTTTYIRDDVDCYLLTLSDLNSCGVSQHAMQNEILFTRSLAHTSLLQEGYTSS